MPGVLIEKPQAAEEVTPMEVKEMGSEAAAEVKESIKNDAPASRPTVGIIYPPPEVRNIVDKTADFVARNGPEFEERIKINEAGNSKFNFLNRTDPYHAYYEHKIEEIKEGVAQEQLAAQQLGYIPPAKQTPITMLLDSEVPRDPPPEFDFVVEPPSISAMELDIVKLTAQFVARNGASFLDELMMREQRNYQFDFLRKQHPLFVYFTKLVEQYSKVFLPAYNTLPNLRKTVENPASLLDQSQHRMLWEQYQKKQRQKAEEEQEKKRVEYAQIDWHDFVIVETINFRENEAGYLPPPIRPSQLAQRLLQQSKFDRMAEDGGEVEEIEMEVEEQDQGDQATPTTGAGDAKKMGKFKQSDSRVSGKPPSPPSQPSIQPKGPVQVRRGYNPKSAQPQTTPSGTGQFLISPITGEKIPAEKMEEHMKYGLLDPRWTEEKKKQIAEKKTKEEVYAEGVHIGSSLKRLAERRTDIFGMEETMIGQKIGEEEAPKPISVQWDGHSGSADIIAREAQANIGEQLKAIERAKEQAEKEKFGPTLLKTPINSAPPARPPSSVQFQGGIRGPPHMQRGPPLQPRPPHMGQQPPMGVRPDIRPHPQMQMMPPHMMGSQGHPMMQHPHPHGMMQLANSAPGMAPLMQPRPPFMQQNFPPNMGPPLKRPHLDSEDLIPEQEFISKHPGTVTFKVQIPNIQERSEWKLNGQVLAISLPITDFASVIKAKISDELGMPSGKQKLQIGPVFIKDSLSLGYYNITPNTVVLLGLKERGGRKK